MAELARYLVERFNRNETEKFNVFFEAVELILNSCDAKVKNLIVVGLFEDIQNAGGTEINYYTSFDKWLKPMSKAKWDEIIDVWEGRDWRRRGSQQ